MILLLASAQWRKVFENFLGCYFGLLHYGPAAAATRTMDASELGALVLAPLAGVEEIEELRAAVEAAVEEDSRLTIVLGVQRVGVRSSPRPMTLSHAVRRSRC